MKKLVSFCVVLTLLFSLCMPFVRAAGGLSEKEATDIFMKAYVRANAVIYDYNSEDVVTAEERKKIVPYEYMNLYYGDHGIGDPVIITDTSLSGEKYPREYDYYYVEATKYDRDADGKGISEFITMDFMDSFLLEYFTPEMKNRLCFDKWEIYDKETYEVTDYVYVDRFRTDPETGYLLGLSDTMWHFDIPYFLTMEDDDVKYVGFTSGESKAELKVLVYKRFIMFGYASTIETVEFERTKSGWKISGGSFFDVCFIGEEPSYNYEYTEFELLAMNAYTEASILYRNYSNSYLYPQTSKSGKEYYIRGSMELFLTYDDATIVYTHSTNGEEYDSPEIYYRAEVGGYHVSGLYGRVEEYKDRLSSVMLPSLYEPWLYSEDGVEFFRNEYITQDGILVSERFLGMQYERGSLYNFSKYGGVRMISANKAKVDVILYLYHSSSGKKVYYTTEFDAVKTPDGWRASGGEMFDVIRGNAVPKPYTPVNTGDDSGERVIFLVFLSTVSLAAACRKVTRRR